MSNARDNTHFLCYVLISLDLNVVIYYHYLLVNCFHIWYG